VTTIWRGRCAAGCGFEAREPVRAEREAMCCALPMTWERWTVVEWARFVVAADGYGTVASRDDAAEAHRLARITRHNLNDTSVRVRVVKATSRRLKKVSP
jgi:hypothetical protein